MHALRVGRSRSSSKARSGLIRSAPSRRSRHATSACLAANQIGVAKAVIVYHDENEQPHVMYNPVLKQALGAYKTVEGCLTLESESKVTRYERVKVVYDELVDGALVSRKRDFTGWPAELIQHMIDHCKGKLV